MLERTFDLQDSPDEPRRARAFVTAQLDTHDTELRDDALLLVSELVTNVIQHGALPARLTMNLDTRCLRVDVQDRGTTLPTGPKSVDPRSSNGRGLMIVDALAQTWGIDEAVGRVGKTVWFELAVR